MQYPFLDSRCDSWNSCWLSVHLGWARHTAYLTQDFSCHVALEALQNSLIMSTFFGIEKDVKIMKTCLFCYKTRKGYKNKIGRERNCNSALPSRKNINRALWYILTVQMENKDTFLEEQDKQLPVRLTVFLCIERRRENAKSFVDSLDYKSQEFWHCYLIHSNSFRQ